MSSDPKFHYLKALTDEEIDSLGLSLADLWMLQAQDSRNPKSTQTSAILGPFPTHHLQENAQIHAQDFESCMAYNLASEKWRDFYQIPEFQRRKPKLVPAQNLIKNEDFLVLVRGQKQGPFSLGELKSKLQSNEIDLSNEVSVDAGKTWIKLYEHHAFDRRFKKNHEDLPFSPRQQVFEQGNEEISLKLVKLQQDKEEDAALSGLAFLGRGNDKGQLIRPNPTTDSNSSSKSAPNAQSENVDSTKEQMPTLFERLMRQWKMALAAPLMALLALTIFIQSNGDDNNQLPLGEKRKVAIESINNNERSPASEMPRTEQTYPQKPKQNEQIQRPERYQAPRARAASAHIQRPRAQGNRLEPRGKRISHTIDDYDIQNMPQDPYEEVELARQIASEMEQDELPPEEHEEYMDEEYGAGDSYSYPEERTQYPSQEGADYPQEMPGYEQDDRQDYDEQYRYD